MNRKNLLAAGGVVAVLTFGWYQFVWQSQAKAATAAQKAESTATASAAKLKNQVVALERTKTEIEAQTGSVELIGQAIPADAGQSSLMKLLQAKAHEHNVSLGSLTNGQVSAPPSTAAATGTASADTGAEAASEIALTITVHGGYTDVVSYVNDLASLPRLIVVDALSLTSLTAQAKPGEPVGPSQISASITARAFTTAAPPLAPGVTAPPTTATTAATGGSSATTAAAKAGAGTTAVP